MPFGIPQTETREFDFKKQCTFRQGASGIGVQVIRDSEIWYVDSGKANAVAGNGRTWNGAFLTIAAAIAAAGDDDIIYVAPGDYEISAALAVTQSGLTIIGPNRSCNDYKALVYSDGAMNLMNIDANNVSITGLGFSTVGGNGDCIVLSATTVSYKCYIAHCRFDGYSKTGSGITCDTTNDTPDLTVEHCLFRSFSAEAIDSNATRAVYRHNMIWVTAGSVGIDFKQTAGNRPDNMAYGNMIIGSNSTDTGIKIASTEPTDGTLLIANNVVTNCNLNITQDKSDAGVVNNGTYGNGTAPFQVDPNA